MTADAPIDDTADNLPADIDPMRLTSGEQNEQIELARFEKRAGQIILVKLVYLSGWRLDVRLNFFDAEGRLQPTRQGASIPLRHLETFADAVATARTLARYAGLMVASTAEPEKDQADEP